MNKSSKTSTIRKRINELKKKYDVTGQDLLSNLEGLLYADYLKYWDYIHLDTLLSLQNPRTDFPDEKIFITYHQITELYFNLILWEMEQIGNCKSFTTVFFLDKIKRINRYLFNLTQSFDIMIEGMDFEQFRKFRMALLPASGFQSAQFRMIEICSTDFVQLLDKKYENVVTSTSPIEELYSNIYWKKGATTQQKCKNGNLIEKETITSVHFQEKYKEIFINKGKEYKRKNLWQCYLQLSPDENMKEINKNMRKYDATINVDWRLAHYKSAIRYLQRDEDSVGATGGTNWQEYLPPRFQKTIFYPSLWTEEEKENWGKGWVEKYVF